VVGSMGPGCPLKSFWPLTGGLGPVKRCSNIQNQLKLANSNSVPSQGPILFKLCMRLQLDMVNNFLNWPNFKFPK
jgi:hypothetical protein